MHTISVGLAAQCKRPANGAAACGQRHRTGDSTQSSGREYDFRGSMALAVESDMTVTGRCLCGAVRWQSAEAPITTRVCWCRDCQYLGAGSGTVGACFRTATFTVAGTTSDYSSVADSGNRMHRRFCPRCGTPLFSEAEARPHLIFVRVGTFDDPELGKPATSIWTSSAPTWACIDAAAPRVERQPPPAA